MPGQLLEGDHVFEVAKPLRGTEPDPRGDLTPLIGGQLVSIGVDLQHGRATRRCGFGPRMALWLASSRCAHVRRVPRSVPPFHGRLAARRRRSAPGPFTQLGRGGASRVHRLCFAPNGWLQGSPARSGAYPARAARRRRAPGALLEAARNELGPERVAHCVRLTRQRSARLGSSRVTRSVPLMRSTSCVGTAPGSCGGAQPRRSQTAMRESQCGVP